MPPTPATTSRSIGDPFRVFVVAACCCSVLGCGAMKEKLAGRFGQRPSRDVGNLDEGERQLANLLVDDHPRQTPVPANRRQGIENRLATVEIERASATRVTSAAHGRPSDFAPVRPRAGGSVRLTAQQLRAPTFDDGPATSVAPAPQPAPLATVDSSDDAAADRRLRIPTRAEGTPETDPVVEITSREDRISLVVRDAPIGTVLAIIAQQQGLNIIAADGIPTPVSVTLQDVRLDDALNTLLTVAGYTWVRQKDIIVVSRISSENRLAPHLQGRVIRVFPLSFVAATDVQSVVTGLLSPMGTVQVLESSSLDKRRTQESIVVEDLPGYMERVANYIAQIDRAPRQVLVEAHVLQVALDDSCRHGVNFQYLSQIAGTNLSLSTTGFANAAGSPSFFLGLNNTELDSLLEALKSTVDAKTLASPKVMVVNGQEARIQIGESLGYFVTTTTETSTLQNVDFIDLGVVLNVTPIIGEDGNILMSVRPEVSSGQINDITGLPEEDTTEVDTTVMLRDGQAMIIGGLIKEEAIDQQSKIAWLGDLWRVGRLFQRRSVVRTRSEVIVALVPRIVPHCGAPTCREVEQLERTHAPILTPDLKRAYRPWEPELDDAVRKPIKPKFRLFR